MAYTETRTVAGLAATHARFQVLETVRVPIAVVSTVAFPSLALIFFVAMIGDVGGDPIAATTAVTQLAVFSLISTCLYTTALGVADDRDKPWDGYLRTLPAGPAPRMAGRLITVAVFAVLGLVPLVITGWLLTAADAPMLRVLAGLAVLPASGLPFLLGGFAIGYSMPMKAAIPTVQLLLFPMAFGGGLFLPPLMFPGWVDTLSTLLPSRGGRDLAVWAVLGERPDPVALAALAAWTVGTAALAVWAYRRDEGRRFR